MPWAAHQRAAVVQEPAPHAQRNPALDGGRRRSVPSARRCRSGARCRRDGDQLDRRFGGQAVVVNRFAALERFLVERRGAFGIEGRPRARVDEQRLDEQRLVAGGARIVDERAHRFERLPVVPRRGHRPQGRQPRRAATAGARAAARRPAVWEGGRLQRARIRATVERRQRQRRRDRLADDLVVGVREGVDQRAELVGALVEAASRATRPGRAASPGPVSAASQTLPRHRRPGVRVRVERLARAIEALARVRRRWRRGTRRGSRLRRAAVGRCRPGGGQLPGGLAQFDGARGARSCQPRPKVSPKVSAPAAAPITSTRAVVVRRPAIVLERRQQRVHVGEALPRDDRQAAQQEGAQACGHAARDGAGRGLPSRTAARSSAKLSPANGRSP